MNDQPRFRAYGNAVLFASLLVMVTGVCVGAEPAGEAGRREFFEARIRPVLVGHCQECHGPKKQAGGLRVDWREPMIKGGESGVLFEAGHPEDSLLIRVVDHSEIGLEMPKGSARLPERVVKDFRQWIGDGAYDPRVKAPTAEQAAEEEWGAKLTQRRQWWSLQPMKRAAAPECRTKGWARDSIDAFVLAKLEAAGLAPAVRAERAVMARRLAFVLTGLPPRVEELRGYLNDPAPDDVATDRLVDRYLASPRFGERWARHWMDVVRFGDTYGYEWDMPAKGAWRYRDYLVRAFNGDVGFDRLVREQVAGDLLAGPRINRVDQINESLIGPMFFQLGEKRHGDSAEFDGIHQEMVHNKIDAFSKAFQGVTIGCARCHDHKLDAVSQREYYALAGSFMSSRWVTHTVDTPERNAAVIGELGRIKGRLRKAIGEEWMRVAAAWPEGWASEGGAWGRAVAKAGAGAGIEDLLHPWVTLKQGGDVAGAWSRLAARYAAEQRARVEANAKNFVVIADFSKGVPAGWSVDGVGLWGGPGRSGDFTVALEGERAVGSVLPAGLFTHAISPRLNGAVRSPLLSALARPWLSVRTCGGDFSAERTVVDNAFLTERQKYLASRDLQWSSVPPAPEFAGRRVFFEVATKSSNPNFPPRVGLGGECSESQVADPRSWFGVTRAVAANVGGVPADELGRFDGLFGGASGVPRSMADVAGRYAGWLRGAVERFGRDVATDEDVVLIQWMIDRELLPNRSDGVGMVGELVREYRQVERRLLDPGTVHGMADIESGYDYRLNVRGEYDQLGAAVPRGYLGVLAESDSSARFGDTRSGRRELAERVASAGNPLTARVYVNRVWQWVFGAGIVATVDDFGRLGSAASHPELLDLLALEFIDHGWSTKWLVRRLLGTATLRQGNGAEARAVSTDPDNRLLHHYSLRRLEAEEIRDAVLAVTGRLEPALYGAPIDPHRTSEDPMKRLFSGPLDGKGRRSIYIKLTIMEPPRFLATFNQPAPKIPTGRRDVTNTPAQALTLLNDPFVHVLARYWGQRLAARDGAVSVDERLTGMFLEALGRAPSAEELVRWRGLMDRVGRERGVAADAVGRDASVWSDVAHTMINTKEFLYYR